MANEMRDRLVELLDATIIVQSGEKALGDIADHLIENGVIVPPCKVGDKLYFLYDKTFANRPSFKPYIYETSDWYFDIDQKGISILPRSIHSYKGKHHYYLGETVFFTKSEAEQKLKEKRGGNDL